MSEADDWYPSEVYFGGGVCIRLALSCEML